MNAFEQGYADFEKGQITNPYTKGTPKYSDWDAGFNRAYFRNLERVRANEARRGSQGVQGQEATQRTA